MKKLALFLLLGGLSFSACQNDNNTTVKRTETKVLIFSSQETTLDAEKYYQNTSDLAHLEEEKLFEYSTLVLYNANINDFKPYHKSAIQRYVQAGGGLVAINNPEPLPYSWHWYKTMYQDAFDKEAGTFELESEEANLQIGYYDGGKIALAKDSLSKEDATAALAIATTFTISENVYNMNKVTALAAPYDHNFTRITLDDDTDEPMEMAILPDNRVIWIERRGKMKIYEPKNKASRVLHTFDVCTAGNYEDGLLGLELDPNYGKDNHYIYMYYSPVCDTPYQYLSRYIFKDDSIHVNSEKLILRVKVQRETCCHSGGSIEFGGDGLLYLSTGDNTSSKESDGFTPIDERAGRSPFDAQKSSGNTHDLRGKILRIKLEDDGSYSIPDGNLFAKDGSEGRPEIYVMGARNPFRIGINPKTNTLYWGDVGPDGGEDGLYGPQSYDEWNQAKTAGNYGWPYFVGDNKAYPDRDFTTGKAGELFDPQKPINESPYNTGNRELPPAQSAMIWYPYGTSPEFPLLGQGSRSSMGGPFFFKQPSYRKFVSMPDYLDGKMFIYEWARSWIMLITFNENEEMVQMEYFLPNMDISKPIDMKIGPDGALYILEYGASYFLDNPDAALTRIEYSEINKAPVAMVSVDKPNGKTPHTANFSAEGSFDYDSDEELIYEWYFTDANSPDATGKEVSFTFKKEGNYTPKLVITDKDKATTEATIDVMVGNAPPQIDISWKGNKTFYFENQKSLDYKVTITDEEDETINEDNATFDISYISDIDYFNGLANGKKPLPESSLKFVQGKKLMDDSDCATCHQKATKSIGPSYEQVAQRYKGEYTAVEQLAQKVIKGGNGVWGESMMAAHPQISVEDAQEMIKYILSVGETEVLPLEGSYTLPNNSTGGYLVSATYKDNGVGEFSSITERKVHFLRSAILQAEHYDEKKNVGESRFGRGLKQSQVGGRSGGYIMFEAIDLTDISKIVFYSAPLSGGGKMVARIDAPDGRVVGTATMPVGSWETRDHFKEYTAKVNSTGTHNLYIVFENSNNAPIGNIDWMRFER